MIELFIIVIIIVAFGGVAFIGAPYVPSLRSDLRRAFSELYTLSERDLVVDMGCGDGVVLREAAKRGARGVGYELNPFMTVIARLLCRRFKQIQIIQANFWTAQVPEQTTLVYTFGDSRDIERMASWVEAQATRLGRPLFFMSYGFRLADRQPLREVGAHLLYEIMPLQMTQPQV